MEETSIQEILSKRFFIPDGHIELRENRIKAFIDAHQHPKRHFLKVSTLALFTTNMLSTEIMQNNGDSLEIIHGWQQIDT